MSAFHGQNYKNDETQTITLRRIMHVHIKKSMHSSSKINSDIIYIARYTVTICFLENDVNQIGK